MAGDWTNLPYDEAVQRLRDLRPMTDDEFQSLEVEIAAVAFAVARLTKMNLLQWLLEKSASVLASGGTTADFDAEIETLLADALTEAHIESLAALALQRQYGAGVFQQGTDADLIGRIWGWEYLTQRDERVRATHRALEGKRFVVSDAAAYAVFPPWDWGCRCGARWIPREQIPAGTESDPLPGGIAGALADSDYSSPALGAPYEPDLTGFDPRLLNAYANDQAVN